ncbi:GNAT family N-acetyltransferase [Sutcliffiella rhizosphaerae]|uniref:Phosphinothricin acetyltransferase YwnH n=1 Tax=Sutcliffiella rhizosphaerae TaxID=2880967 RepID=A0ABM8YJA8_9BACI|nr:GNAT family N-acetyltransferase [Sutcliffiella rhizosphaerae]CAG9619942.1 Putative phosphinothricin acetyltransferase YwnH [Sutcliffiella rhizosphaerae]
MNNLPIKIRKAAIHDLSAVVAIYNSTIASRMVTADTEEVVVEKRLDWFHQHHDKRPLWIVECDNEICAWISFQDFYGRPAYSATAEVSIYLHESMRGKGLGGTLLQWTFEQSKDLQIENLVAFIFAHNRPSIRLFEKYGFEQWGLLPQVAELDNIKRDLVILGKKINS